ncbi:MAG: PLP-dependent aminotransferase family protein [Holophagales bacterium]|nr:PLP-dependent aminotransferase family protein [Holophagales bacterium]MYC11834.1 PLP-dependent aminotransferase family protein [Holophagales bacterium]
MAVEIHHHTTNADLRPPLGGRVPGQPVMAHLLAPWLRGRERSLLRRLVNRVARRDVTSLAGGLPAVDLFPRDAYGEKLRELLADPRSVQYGPPSGDLKEQIALLMRRRGVPCRPEEILITAGAQQALQVAVAALVARGQCVALERFVYTGVREALAPHSPRLLTLPSSLDDGLDVEALERCLLAGERPRLVYVIPDAHNPLGVSLTWEKRERLVVLARDYDFAILEDDPYGLLCCDGEFERPLAALDSERVIHVGTFSKILAPALRVGWMRLPAPLVDRFAAVKEAGDLECSRLMMLAVGRLLADLDFDRHLELLRSTYRRRRDAMLEELEDQLPDGCAFSEPAGGMFVWVELPPDTDGERLLERALAEHGVAFVPSAAFADVHDLDAPANAVRLSFSTLEPESLRVAVAKFAACLREWRREQTTGGRGR